MARPKGLIRLKITFESFDTLNPEIRSVVEVALGRAASELGVWVGDFIYEESKLNFTIQYKINTNILGAITNLKAMSSRSANKFLNEKSDNKSIKETFYRERRQEIPGLMNLEVFKSLPTKQKEFWVPGYTYKSVL